MATAAVGAAAALLCALVTFWKLRWTHWFWPVFIAIAFVHTAAILLIRWPDYYIPGPVLRPFLMADGMAVIIVIASIDWLVRRWKKRERE